MAENFPRGRFVWHELVTTDADAAVSFYSKVIGWTTAPFEHDPSYRMWVAGQTPIGGVIRIPEEAKRMGAPPQWLPFVAVPDVDATARQAVSLGGRVYVAAIDMAAGRSAVLADPQGARFAVYRSTGETGGHDGPFRHGEFCWNELATTDASAAWYFYQALFGWVKTSALDMGPAGMYQMFGRGGAPLGGIYRKTAEMTGPPHWMCYVEVAGVDKIAPLLPKLGGRVVNGPMEVPGGGRIAMCVDPQGAAFGLHTQKAAAVMASTPKPAAKPAATEKAKPAPKKKKSAPPRKPKKAKKVKKSAPAKAKRKAKKKNKPRRRTAPRRKAKKKTRRR